MTFKDTQVLQDVDLLSNLREPSVMEGILEIIIEYVPGGSLVGLLKEFGVLPVTPKQRYIRGVRVAWTCSINKYRIRSR